ncbi:MAG: hypothetical protein AABY22_16295 [Nanoarchaeota archaeon]
MSKMTKKNGITTVQIYELVNQVRKELSDDIGELRKSFQDFELGRLTNLEKDLEGLKSGFDPVKKIVYGLVGIILTGVIGAILFMVLK